MQMLLLFLLIAALPAQATLSEQEAESQPAFVTASKEIPHFRIVTPGLIRGGQPTLEGVRYLQSLGVKTVINLRNEKKSPSKEEYMARLLGMQYVNIPMTGLTEPSPTAILQFLNIVRNPANQPVFVHCLHGQDRTSAMIGIYHIAVDGWDAASAYRDMLKNGFHSILVPLADAVFDYAEAKGWRTPRPIGVIARDWFAKDRESEYYKSLADL